jgi:hypothetical protein
VMQTRVKARILLIVSAFNGNLPSKVTFHAECPKTINLINLHPQKLSFSSI